MTLYSRESQEYLPLALTQLTKCFTAVAFHRFYLFFYIFVYLSKGLSDTRALPVVSKVQRNYRAAWGPAGKRKSAFIALPPWGTQGGE